MKFSIAVFAGALSATALLSAFNPAYAQAGGAGITVGGLKINGFLDGFYQYDFNRPPFGTSLGSSGRLFDTTNNSFTLAAARVNILRTPDERGRVGVNVQFLLGPNADLLHAFEPGGVERYKNIQQAFVTYQTKGARPVTVDFGKFAAWIGYESLDSLLNENYSRAFNFNLGQPNYTAGIRATKALTDSVSAGLFLANGFNETEDGNAGKTLGASVTLGGARRRGNVSLLWWSGPEGGQVQNSAGGFGGINFAVPGTLNVNIGNVIATYQADARTRFAFDGYYASASSRNRDGGTWNGQAVYVRRQLSSTSATALRLERLEDFSALRTGARRKLHSATGTYEYIVGGALTNRLEVRRDFASDQYFPRNGNRQTGGRTTLTFAALYAF